MFDHGKGGGGGRPRSALTIRDYGKEYEKQHGGVFLVDHLKLEASVGARWVICGRG